MPESSCLQPGGRADETGGLLVYDDTGLLGGPAPGLGPQSFARSPAGSPGGPPADETQGFVLYEDTALLQGGPNPAGRSPINRPVYMICRLRHAVQGHRPAPGRHSSSRQGSSHRPVETVSRLKCAVWGHSPASGRHQSSRQGSAHHPVCMISTLIWAVPGHSPAPRCHQSSSV